MKPIYIPLMCLVGATMVACGTHSPKQPEVVQPLHEFAIPIPPVTFDRWQQLEFARDHFWDNFRFADTTALATVDTVAMLQRFGQFTALCTPEPTNGLPMQRLMKRAAASRPMMDLFLFLADQVLHDPNSPLRSDEFYIPVLEAQLAASWYDEYERIAPAYDLEMARKNRIGHPAADFAYTTANGITRSLYDLKAEFVLLFFNNPDCAMCKGLREQIGSSEVLSSLIAEGRLKVLALYPDEDLKAWQAYRPNIPAHWINAYDKGCVIREQHLYDINAIPSLYLLNSEKRVLVKDSTEVGELEAALQQ